MDFEKASVYFILRFQIETLHFLCFCFQQPFKLARKSMWSSSNQLYCPSPICSNKFSHCMVCLPDEYINNY